MVSSESSSDTMEKWNANVQVLETDIIKPSDSVTIEVIDLQIPDFSSIMTLSAGALSVGTIKTECL